MSNPHSPEPARWILEMSAPDIPAWNRAFNELERKRLSELEDMLVHSFERYLRRKGYLTERQVEVLQGIARKHGVPLPQTPPLPRHTESSHTEKASALLQQIQIPELESRENARWLALLIDAEGSLGWTRRIMRRDRINGYKYEHRYGTPYISAEMNELESKETILEGARLIGAVPLRRVDRVTGEPTRYFSVTVGRATATMRHIKPYLVKFNRLAKLCLVIFKHRTYVPLDQFDRIIETLFNRTVTSKEANEILLNMSDTEYQRLLSRADKLAPR